ncbi:Protein srek1IP1 [Geranomyces variabilis]|uniref:Protein srek1IP1 n=1 Tax=Geranomyces variabilis TaxID=109894 RepID=A0AAD5TKN3_9FUNG|nr:Protein srek1IP1 [Geranomyces variabilis]
MASRNLVRAVGISALATEHILHTLFSFLGTVRELKLSQSSTEPGVQNAFIEFEDPAAAMAALHLTGTQLGDRALFVTISTQLPQQPPSLVISAANAGAAGGSAHTALLSASSPSGTPVFRNPNLTATILHHDPQKADEISRTIYIGNIPHEASEEDLRATFAACGDIIAVKIAGDAHQTSRFAFMEFATEEAAGKAMLLSGVLVRDRPVKVNFSKNTIAKAPRVDSTDPAMRRVAEAQAAIRRKYTSGGGTDDDHSPGAAMSASDMRGPPPPPPPPPPRKATTKEPSSQIDRHISVIERDGTTRRISRSPSPSTPSRRRVSSPPRHRRSSDHHRRRPRSRSRSRSPVRSSRRSTTSAVTSSSRRSSRSRSRSRSPSYRSSRYRSGHRSRHRSRRRSPTRSRSRTRSVSPSLGGGGGGSPSRKKAKVVFVNREEGSRKREKAPASPGGAGAGAGAGDEVAATSAAELKRSKVDAADGDDAPSTPVKGSKRRRSPSPHISPPGVVKKER